MSEISRRRFLAVGATASTLLILPSESKAEDTQPSRSQFHLKVDFAARSGPDTMDPIPETVKDGWWTWTLRDWDFYRTDLNWHDGGASYPDDSGIDGSGVHAAITCHYEGIMAIHVAGMRRYLAGGIQPEKEPIHDPLANTWVAGTDFPGRPSDILLGLYHLPAGEYRLLSYHNSFNARRFGDNPTGIEYRFTNNPQHPMPAIRVYSMKSVMDDYIEETDDTLVKDQTYGLPDKQIVIGDLVGTGDVTQTLVATDVEIQQVTDDSELVPSVIEFTTDGSPLLIVYEASHEGNCDIRPHREGSYAALNAFELIQLSDAE
ncbi:MAG: hypothetical protein R6W89_12315 [Candidatus Hydrogenedentota bacterium]